MRLSTAGFVILLNSDTVVTQSWAEKLADVAYGLPGVGIVGPLSNAASHQSIPEHRSSATQTAVNVLPQGWSPEDVNRLCERWTIVDVLPLVPLIHGFCFGVRRDVIEAIGLFDEERFPRGYGEENDYCFRAADSGFGLAVASHTYVFHAKSRSYDARDRVALMRAGSASLKQMYGNRRVDSAVRSMQEHPLLRRVRALARQDLVEERNDG
jgi:GT2 family glycosyltransferase